MFCPCHCRLARTLCKGFLAFFDLQLLRLLQLMVKVHVYGCYVLALLHEALSHDPHTPGFVKPNV
jgi:hypothetical protein